jgi:uncharacterized protein
VDTLGYLVREMRQPDGGFSSSQDADSEGVEGKYFVWSWDELLEVTSDEPVARAWGADPAGNWDGANVLWHPRPAAAFAMQEGVSPAAFDERIDAARARLFARRTGRVPPATDDKVLVAWNAMAVSALAEAGRALDDPALVDVAAGAADFLLGNLRREDGRLLRSWRAGAASPVPAYADDHALLTEALLTLYETTFDLRWFREARRVADDLIALFLDPERGGFFQTGTDAEALLLRPKELFDNAVPSGNSAAALALQRLALLTGEPAYERAAASALRLVRDLVERAPSAFGHALSALDLYVGPAREVAIVGDPTGPDTLELLRVVRGGFRPNVVLALAASDDTGARTAVGLLRDRPPIQWQATAYVCERFVCRRPVTAADDLAEQLAT